MEIDFFGCDLLVHGLRWGVDNGEWIPKDTWIPGFQVGTLKPLSPIPGNAKVRFLMNEAGTRWEEETFEHFSTKNLQRLSYKF
jgi:hypothetical protein